MDPARVDRRPLANLRELFLDVPLRKEHQSVTLVFSIPEMVGCEMPVFAASADWVIS